MTQAVCGSTKVASSTGALGMDMPQGSKHWTKTATLQKARKKSWAGAAGASDSRLGFPQDPSGFWPGASFFHSLWAGPAGK